MSVGMIMRLLRRLFHSLPISLSSSLVVYINTKENHNLLTFGLSRCSGTNYDHEKNSCQPTDAQALSTRRLDNFFADKHVKSSSPSSWGQRSINSATKSMQAKLRSFDLAFYVNDTHHT